MFEHWEATIQLVFFTSQSITAFFLAPVSYSVTKCTFQEHAYVNWKDHIHELSKKISRGIGVLLKLRRCVSNYILLRVYSIVYLFFTYGVLIWGHTYETSLHPLIVLQKKGRAYYNIF